MPFNEYFTHQDRYTAKSEDDDGEENSTFSGYEVDLEKMAFTLTLLELPIRFLCRPDCDGYKRFAPQYTGNDGRENPFAVLGKLLNNDLNDQEV